MTQFYIIVLFAVIQRHHGSATFPQKYNEFNGRPYIDPHYFGDMAGFSSSPEDGPPDETSANYKNSALLRDTKVSAASQKGQEVHESQYPNQQYSTIVEDFESDVTQPNQYQQYQEEEDAMSSYLPESKQNYYRDTVNAIYPPNGDRLKNDIFKIINDAQNISDLIVDSRQIVKYKQNLPNQNSWDSSMNDHNSYRTSQLQNQPLQNYQPIYASDTDRSKNYLGVPTHQNVIISHQNIPHHGPQIHSYHDSSRPYSEKLVALPNSTPQRHQPVTPSYQSFMVPSRVPVTTMHAQQGNRYSYLTPPRFEKIQATTPIPHAAKTTHSNKYLPYVQVPVMHSHYPVTQPQLVHGKHKHYNNKPNLQHQLHPNYQTIYRKPVAQNQGGLLQKIITPSLGPFHRINTTPKSVVFTTTEAPAQVTEDEAEYSEDGSEENDEEPDETEDHGVAPGPVHSFIKTDRNANYKWGVRVQG